jgi:glyoxylase-like metal-dependent hydrolase (beta-lactamase superfamily II)
MKYTLQLFPTAEIPVPCPEVYWMERFSEWTTLQFQAALIRGGDHTILLNTGFPAEIEALAKAWRDFLGEPAVLKRPDEWLIEAHLEKAGLSPDDITHVLITPIQLYATGGLHLFRQADFYVSRRGWIEDIVAPEYPHHIPRQGCISDDHFHWLMGENRGRLILVPDETELLPGLRLRWVGTHHRSSMAVDVDTAAGRVIITDAAFHYANLEEGKPLGIAESIIEAHAAYDWIRRTADLAIPLYDPLVHQRHPGGRVA